jgi:hypothetical protein
MSREQILAGIREHKPLTTAFYHSLRTQTESACFAPTSGGIFPSKETPKPLNLEGAKHTHLRVIISGIDDYRLVGASPM